MHVCVCGGGGGGGRGGGGEGRGEGDILLVVASTMRELHCKCCCWKVFIYCRMSVFGAKSIHKVTTLHLMQQQKNNNLKQAKHTNKKQQQKTSFAATKATLSLPSTPACHKWGSCKYKKKKKKKNQQKNPTKNNNKNRK